MKELIYSKKYPKLEKGEYTQKDFEELFHRETENEFRADMFKSKYRHELLCIDDKNCLREKHIKACVEFARSNEKDVEVLMSKECVYINISFDGMIDITSIKESIDFADKVRMVSGIGDRDITLSLTFQTHKIVFFNKRE